MTGGLTGIAHSAWYSFIHVYIKAQIVLRERKIVRVVQMERLLFYGLINRSGTAILLL